MNKLIHIYIKCLYVLLMALLFTTVELFAQDMQFTQFYAAPTYLNPAFTGANACHRVSSNYRDQWPSIPGKFVSYTLSYDHFVSSLNSGLGILLTNDKAGSGNLRTSGYHLLYSYHVPLNRKWAMRAGFQGSYNTRGINFFNLVFGDQIARGGVASSVQAPPQDKVFYFDASAGLLAHSDRHWFGISLHHFNQPNQSFLGEESLLPRKYSFHAGTNFKVDDAKNKNESISPAINYKAQGKFDQVDVGLYYNKMPMVFGIWYRGLPGFKAYAPGYPNNDAIALLLGLQVDRLRLGYSYDITISRLVGSTAGAHEVSLSHQFCDPNKKRKKKRIVVPCPKF